MRRAGQVLAGLIFLVLGQGTSSWACSCAGQTLCGAHRYRDADFVGDVLSRRVVVSDDRLGPDRVLYKVRVVETFRGMEKAGEIVSVRTGFGGGDCGYTFEIGSRYLIDASKDDNVFLTGICSLTARIGNSEVELRSLRKIAAGQRLPDLVGVLMRGTETNDGETFTPLSGVSVEAKSMADGSAQKALTDVFGSFTFEKLPEGKNDLIFGLPSNMSAAYSDSGFLTDDHVPSISIDSRDAGSAACHMRIIIEPAASISGIVQSDHGAPIEGWVNADTVTSDDKPWNTVRTAVPGPDGKFSLDHLNPGRYSVQFTSRVGFVRGKQQIIELADGERRTGVILLSR